MTLTYKEAGVDIDAGDRLIAKIGPLAAATRRPEVLSGLGGFAGLCRLPDGLTDPVLVSGTDGVGTKLKSAFATGRHDTVGIDLVAMAVNDVIVTGAEPLFFLDYFATGKLDVDTAEAVIRGIADGCLQAHCALLGGETAELPSMYADGEYDLAGFCVAVVDRPAMVTGKDIAVGDRVIGLSSSGLHSNGHSLARKAILEKLGLDWQDTPAVLAGSTVADALLRPTRIYVDALAAVRQAGVTMRGAAHITGGGLIENPPRVLGSDDLGFVFDCTAWTVPPIFQLVASAGVSQREMRRTFNMGIGMVVVVAADACEAALSALAAAGETAAVIGHIEARTSGHEAVRFEEG